MHNQQAVRTFQLNQRFYPLLSPHPHPAPMLGRLGNVSPNELSLINNDEQSQNFGKAACLEMVIIEVHTDYINRASIEMMKPLIVLYPFIQQYSRIRTVRIVCGW